MRKPSSLSILFVFGALVLTGPQLQGQEEPPETPSIPLVFHEAKKVGLDLVGLGIELTLPLKCEKNGAIAFLGIDFHPGGSGRFAVYEVEAPGKYRSFNYATLELIRIYRSSDESPRMGFACFQDGIFTYLKQDPKDGSLLIGSASIEK